MDITEKARIVFANDIFATQQTGIDIEQVCEECIVCTLDIDSRHCNVKGAVMGGVIFTLADFAFAIAANYESIAYNDSQLHWVSSSSTINYLSPVKGNRLIAKTECIKKGRNQSVFLIHVSDNTNKRVALVTTIGTHI